MIWTGILFVQILLFYWASFQEDIIIWHGHFFEFQKEIHQYFFSVFPFSVGDVFYLFLGTGILYFLVKSIKFRKLEITSLLIGVNIFYFSYQIFWGLLYFQAPLINQFSSQEFHQKEVEKLTWKYLELCKNYRERVLEDKNGVFQLKNRDELQKTILNSQEKLPLKFKKPSTGLDLFKSSLFSSVMSFTGISGYYNPFSAEAQYNTNLPDTQLPFTMAHESAHQLGFAREQEANFIGFLLGMKSDNQDLAYSTYWYTLKSLLRFQLEQNPQIVEEVKNSFSEGMQRDYANEQRFYREHSGRLTDFFAMTNDWFLKSNQQEGSITYSYFVDLLLLYEIELQNKKDSHSEECESKNTNDEKIITPS